MKNFRTRLTSRGYPNNLVDKIISEERENTLTQTQKARKRILPFVTQLHPSLPCLKNILMAKWHLIQNQPLLREIYKDPPLISYRKEGKRLKTCLLKQNYKGFYQNNEHTAGVAQVCQPILHIWASKLSFFLLLLKLKWVGFISHFMVLYFRNVDLDLPKISELF